METFSARTFHSTYNIQLLTYFHFPHAPFREEKFQVKISYSVAFSLEVLVYVSQAYPASTSI